MNRIDQLFSRKKSNLLSIYVTAGYPNLESTVHTVLDLDTAGADLIELGMPYSDPIADGPIIQNASKQAIANGMTVEHLFDQVSQIREVSNIPIIYMGYLNQVMQYGEAKFFSNCNKVGIDGLIIPDLPLEYYNANYKKLVEAAGLAISFLIAPTTATQRREQLAAASSGFVYAVSDSSITGKSNGISAKQIQYFKSLKQITKPTLIGFGIRSSKDFITVCDYANGAIVGSAFINHLGNGLPVKSFISKIKKPEKPVQPI